MDLLLPLWGIINLIMLVLTIIKATMYWDKDEGISLIAMATAANLIAVVILIIIYFVHIYPMYSSSGME